MKSLRDIIGDILDNSINSYYISELIKILLEISKDDISQKFKLNKNRFEELSDIVRILENKYNEIYSTIDSYSEAFNKKLKDQIQSVLELEIKGI